MKIMTKILVLNLLVMIQLVDAKPTVESKIAYDKAQNMRNKAWDLIDNFKHKSDFHKAELILLDALNFVRSKNIKAMYKDDKYLAARQWDILRDLIYSNALQKNKIDALLYLTEFKTKHKILGWVKTEKIVANLLKGSALYKELTDKERAWNRIFDLEMMDSPYQENISIDEKIAGLSQFWSEAKYNFVFFDQVPSLNWDKTYKEYIPKVMASKSTHEYFMLMMRFAALLNDGHSNVYPPNEILKQYFAAPPIRTRLLDKKVVIINIYSESIKALGLVVGDEIISIQGQNVHSYANEYVRPYQSSSTKHDRDLRTYSYSLLRGNKDEVVKLKIRTSNGSEKMVSINRHYEDNQYPKKNNFKILENNIAYISLDGFGDDKSLNNFIASFPQIMKAEGLIIDVRKNGGGSTSYGLSILGYLTDKPVYSSTQRTRKYLGTLRAWGKRDVEWENLDNGDPNHWKQKSFYQGPVALLISAATFSAGEDFSMAFELLKRGPIIGETTGGSTGQPLFFKMPGGGSARVTSKRDGYANGDDWVGIGIEPTIEIIPTIIDIQNNLDPVLNKAIDVLLKMRNVVTGTDLMESQ